jgi:acyl-CoA thioesterase I
VKVRVNPGKRSCLPCLLSTRAGGRHTSLHALIPSSAMNPVVLYFASGDSLYSGAGLMCLALAVSRWTKGHWLIARNSLAWVALAMIVMASPPFAWGIDAMLLGSFSLWFILANLPASGRALAGLRHAATVVLVGLLVVLAATEYPRRRMPVIKGAPSDHLVVIGDSISSGIDLRSPPWPSVFHQMTDVPVKNLARPGARVSDGSSMAANLVPDDQVVLIELGGNDLLADVPAREFEQDLDATIGKTIARRRTVVMFELPLLPNKLAYGQIQRRLAGKYGVWLIPKRYFTDVLGGSNATSDGLHLSTAGADRMAALVQRALSSVLEPRIPRYAH